jgi:hypothetical protein
LRRLHLLPIAFLLLLPGLAPREAAADDTVPLDAFFQGAVVGLDGTKVRLHYDFSDPAQMKDWSEGVPWPIARSPGDGIALAEGRLAVRGSTGARHVAEWEGDLVLTCRLIPDGVKDIGGFLGTPDSATDYVSFSLGETYFHNWDNKPGGDAGMMKFGKQYSAVQKGGFVGFRYLDFRRPTTDPQPGHPLAWSHGRKGGSVLMSVDDMKLDSVEPGNKMKVVQIGFYAIKSSMSVDDVVIEGTLAPRFLAAKKLALRTSRPIQAEVATGVDPAVKALVDGYAAGKESATKLVSIVGDAARPDGDRAFAAQALKAGPRRALPAVVDLLYSADVKARAHGIEIVKAMTGKTYGYDPKGGEKARAAAVRKLNEDLTANPALLQGTGG